MGCLTPGAPAPLSLSSVAHGRGLKGRNLAIVCVRLVGKGGWGGWVEGATEKTGAPPSP